MSLKPSPIEPVPEETARVAKAAFRKGNPLLRLRDELGAIFADADFADLFPRLGQPGLPPWRLALVTILQFRENLPDRQAAEAVRARIDWKYLLGLELTDPGFDHSVLCEFRSRLLAGSAEERLLGKLLEVCQARGLLKARGRQRTDATHVLASIRVLNRLELVGETLRAALNELAAVGPGLAARRGPARLVRALRPPGRGRPPAAGRGRARGLRAHRRRGRVRAARPARRARDTRGLAPAAGGGGPAAGLGPPLRAGGRGASGRRRAAQGQGRPAARDGAGRVALRPAGALPHPLGYLLDRLHRPPHRDVRGRRRPPDHARDDDHRHRARGPVHGRDPPGPGRQGPGAGRAPGRRGLRRRRALGARPRGTGHRPGRPAAAEPVLAGQGRGRLHDRPLRGRLGRAAGALPAGQAVLGLEPARSTRPARPTSRSGSARPTAPPARRGPCAPGPSIRPGT